MKKIVKWTGKEITYGEWPAGIDNTGYSITIYETPCGSLIASIYDATETQENVVVAPSQALLIIGLRDHERAQNDISLLRCRTHFQRRKSGLR